MPKFLPMIDDRLAVLVSSTGTNLNAALNAGLPVYLVMADRHCPGLDVVPKGRVSRTILYPRRFDSTYNKERYSAETARVLREREIGLVWGAGYGTLLHEVFFEEGGYRGRFLNCHPSLNMRHKGPKAVLLTLEAGDEVAGCSLHIATEIMDDDRFILGTWEVPVEKGDTEATLWERIKVTERRVYPAAVMAFRESLIKRDFSRYSSAVQGYMAAALSRSVD